MIPRAVGLALGISLLGPWFALSAPADDETVKLLTRMKHELGEAYVKGDIEALERIYSDDYTVIDADGRTRTRDDDVRALRAKSVSYEFSRYDVTSVRILGDSAILVGRGEVKGVRDGEAFHTTYVSTNVYALKDGAWKIVTAHISGSRPVDPGR